MPYCFMNLHPTADGGGWEPGFPQGTSFLLLADPRMHLGWGIYEYGLQDPGSSWRPEHPVSKDLEALISSGRRYPPALALARGDVSDRFGSHEPSKPEFELAYIDALRKRIRAQASSGANLVRAVGGDGIDLVPGEWYWVLGRSVKNPNLVRWVSDDFFVYVNPETDFDLAAPGVE